MSEDLDQIERDIRTTRARLASNLNVLTSDATIGELKTTMKAEALGVGDDLMDRAKTSGMSMVQRGLEELKQKALENPAAVAAIGAGLGWRLWKHPPIATALVGYGLFSLFRGSERDPLQNAVRDARGHIEDGTAAAMKSARRTAHDLRDKAASMAEDVQRKASSLMGDAQDKAPAATADVQNTASSLTDGARSLASRLSGQAEPMGPDANEFDQYPWPRSRRYDALNGSGVAGSSRSDAQSQLLLSIAGVAVAAAVGVAVNRYRSDRPD